MKVDRTLFLSEKFDLFPIFVDTDGFLEDLNGKLFSILTFHEGCEGNQYIDQKMFNRGQRVDRESDGEYIIELELTKNYLEFIEFDLHLRQQIFILTVCSNLNKDITFLCFTDNGEPHFIDLILDDKLSFYCEIRVFFNIFFQVWNNLVNNFLNGLNFV